MSSRLTDWSKPSLLRTVGLLALLFVAAVALGVAGLPTPATAMFASGIGVALISHHMAVARHAGAEAVGAQLPHRPVDLYPVRMPADRFAYGPTWQIKFLPPARGVTAPGVLCAAPGEVAFVPSKPRHVDRAWSTTNAEVDVASIWINRRACVVRVRGLDDDTARAQFVVHLEPAFVRSALSGYARVVDGSGARTPSDR